MLGGTFAAAIWLDNTTEPEFYAQRSIPVTSPGHTVTVAAADGNCLGSFITWQRRGLVGRWQQTHYNGERDVVPWYDLSRRSYSSTMECSIGPAELHVPVDIDRGVVAACTIDDRCVKVTVIDP